MESEFERLRKKVENFPSASAYNRLAELARLNGSVAEAVAICQRCMKEFPRNGQSYVILAEIALSGGRKDEAMQLLREAVDRDTRSYSGHRMLADVYEEQRDLNGALRHLKLIQAFRPADQGVLSKIQRLQAQLGALASTGRVAATGTVVNGAGAKAVHNGTAAIHAAPPATEPARTSSSAPPRADALAAMCGEAGVVGAVVADAHGRVVVARGLADDRADIIAALSCDMTAAQRAVFQLAGHDQVANWSIEADGGQVIAFQRDPGLTLAVVTKPGVRAALLELRARQALIDLGAG